MQSFLCPAMKYFEVCHIHVQSIVPSEIWHLHYITAKTLFKTTLKGLPQFLKSIV